LHLNIEDSVFKTLAYLKLKNAQTRAPNSEPVGQGYESTQTWQTFSAIIDTRQVEISLSLSEDAVSRLKSYKASTYGTRNKNKTSKTNLFVNVMCACGLLCIFYFQCSMAVTTVTFSTRVRSMVNCSPSVARAMNLYTLS